MTAKEKQIEDIINKILMIEENVNREDFEDCTVYYNRDDFYPISDCLKSVSKMEQAYQDLELNGYCLVQF